MSTLVTYSLYAQTVTNVDAYQDGKEIVITYELDVKTTTKAFYSVDGGKTFVPISEVNGAIGKDAHAGANKFRWNVLKEVEQISSNNVVFKVVPENIKGNVVIKVKPKSTDLVVDKSNKYVVNAPIKITLNEGYHSLYFSKSGYYSTTEHISVIAGETQTISARLNKIKNATNRSYKSTGNGLTRFWDKRGFNIGAGVVAGYDVELGIAGGAGVYWRLFRHNSLFNFNLGCEYAFYSNVGSTFQFPLLINWNMFSMFGDCSDEPACGYIGFGITPMAKYGICPYNLQVAVCLRHWDFKLNAIVSDYQVQMGLGAVYYF